MVLIQGIGISIQVDSGAGAADVRSVAGSGEQRTATH